MSLQHDIENAAGLDDAYRAGLQALRARDRAKIEAVPTRSLSGSVDVDSALRIRFARSPRWDYAIGWKQRNRAEYVYWVEVHPASGGRTIHEVSAKLVWLKEWLGAEGSRLGRYRRSFVWIASGKSAFQQNSPELKKLSMAGVHFAGGHYTIA